MQLSFTEALEAATPEILDKHFSHFTMSHHTNNSIASTMNAAMKARFDRSTTVDLKERIHDAVQGAVSALFVLFTSEDVRMIGEEKQTPFIEAMKAFSLDLAAEAEAVYMRVREDFLTGKKGRTPASYLLGNTRPVYEFVRLDLGIGMHGLANLRKFEGPEGLGGGTTGQDVSKIYAAIRRGQMHDVVAGMFAKYDGHRIVVVEKAKL